MHNQPIAGKLSFTDWAASGWVLHFTAVLATAAVLAVSRPNAIAPAGRALPPLSPRQLAGQRVIYSYAGLVPPPALIAKIEAGEAAGVIFFADNIAGRQQLRAVAAELQRAVMASPVKLPLLLMTDQEGGLVRRLPGPPVLSEKQIGESSDSAAAAREAGRGAAVNLLSVGLNVNLAPVLDVYRSPGDFIDRFQRSYSFDAQSAARLGSDFIDSQQRMGIAATAKHFPGLGSASGAQDTDSRPVILRVSLRALRAADELPYRFAIAGGVRLVMVSWATYPALDPRRPAGLSPAVVLGELRRRLQFTGVTITDALQAGALAPFGTIGHRAVLAAGAGMDLLLCAGQSVGEGTAATDALADALQSGLLDRAAFDASVERVLALRSSLPT